MISVFIYLVSKLWNLLLFVCLRLQSLVKNQHAMMMIKCCYITLQYHVISGIWLHKFDGDALIINHKGIITPFIPGFPVNTDLPSWLTNQTPLTSFLYFGYWSKLLSSTEFFTATGSRLKLLCNLISNDYSLPDDIIIHKTKKLAADVIFHPIV